MITFKIIWKIFIISGNPFITTVTAANTLQQNIARATANNIKDEICSINRTPFRYFYIITVSEQLTTMQWILVFSAIGLASAGVLPHPPEVK
jgi:hypothetical protein